MCSAKAADQGISFSAPMNNQWSCAGGSQGVDKHLSQATVAAICVKDMKLETRELADMEADAAKASTLATCICK